MKKLKIDCNDGTRFLAKHVGVFATCLLLMSACVREGRVWTKEDSWHTGFENGAALISERVTVISSEIIFPIPNTKLLDAIKKLADDSVIPLSSSEAESLVGVTIVDANNCLDQVESNAFRRVRERLEVAKDPAFASVSNSIIREVEQLQQKANIARDQKGQLKPFLTRALVLNAGTGKFYAWEHEGRLWIEHRCLAVRALPMKRWPVVIFLTQEPTSLFLRVTSCE